LLCFLFSCSVPNMVFIMIKLHVHFTQGLGLNWQILDVLIIFIFLKMPIERLVVYVANISSQSKQYRKHVVTHSEVNANMLN
jgi:hypothetical protein